MRRPVALATACALAALTVLPGVARADGDPPSDVLLFQDAYLPYRPKVPQNVADGLTETLKKLRGKGYPLKVAVIATQNDLGSIPTFFGRPQDYANHLQGEIAFNKPEPLLVVMPVGYGVADAGDKAPDVVEELDPPGSGESGDTIGRAAIDAALALAEAEGKAVPAPDLPAAEEEDGGTSPAIVFGVPVLLLAIGGGLAALRARQREEHGEETAA
jgi:hypothetical protein